MAPIGESQRGQNTNDSRREVIESLEAVLKRKVAPAAALGDITEESDYSRQTVHDRLEEVVEASPDETGGRDVQKAKVAGANIYWIKNSQPEPPVGGGGLPQSGIREGDPESNGSEVTEGPADTQAGLYANLEAPGETVELTPTDTDEIEHRALELNQSLTVEIPIEGGGKIVTPLEDQELISAVLDYMEDHNVGFLRAVNESSKMGAVHFEIRHANEDRRFSGVRELMSDSARIARSGLLATLVGWVSSLFVVTPGINVGAITVLLAGSFLLMGAIAMVTNRVLLPALSSHTAPQAGEVEA